MCDTTGLNAVIREDRERDQEHHPEHEHHGSPPDAAQGCAIDEQHERE